MFDKDFSGTIDLYEFQALWHYIQQWKQTFDRYDVNRSGSIEGLELQQGNQWLNDFHLLLSASSYSSSVVVVVLLVLFTL